MNLISKIFGKRKLKSYLLEDKYKIVEAFKLDGITYYQFDDQFEAPTGRQFAAIAIHDEMDMRTDREYLAMHVKAMNKIFSNTKQINLTAVMRLNQNLEERLQMMPLPDYIYKLASVVYFDETEAPFSYDYEYAEKKIKRWKQGEGTLDFFLSKPLKKLMPSLNIPVNDLKIYSQVAKQIDKTHRKHLHDILLEGA